MEKPKQLPEIDIENIKGICQQYIDFVDSPDYHEDNDYRYYIYETTLTAIFGKDVWNFINSKD